MITQWVSHWTTDWGFKSHST